MSSTTVQPNPKARIDLGFASLAAMLEVVVKHLDPLAKSAIDGHFGEGRTVKFFTGVKCPQGTLSIRHLNGDRWKITVCRPAGRGGIAVGTKNVERVYVITTDDDLYAYIDNYNPRNPASIEVAHR